MKKHSWHDHDYGGFLEEQTTYSFIQITKPVLGSVFCNVKQNKNKNKKKRACICWRYSTTGLFRFSLSLSLSSSSSSRLTATTKWPTLPIPSMTSLSRYLISLSFLRSYRRCLVTEKITKKQIMERKEWREYASVYIVCLI